MEINRDSYKFAGNTPSTFKINFDRNFLHDRETFLKQIRKHNSSIFLSKWFGIYKSYECKVLGDPTKFNDEGWVYSIQLTRTFYYFLWIKYKTKPYETK